MSAQEAKADFERLMEQGRAALARGKRDLAHDIWRKAAIQNPYNEQVWLALLDVLDAPADRRVCLQNIVQINPMNAKARRMLHAYEAQAQRRVTKRQKRVIEQTAVKRSRRSLVWRALLLGMIVGLSGVFFGIVLSILIYGI